MLGAKHKFILILAIIIALTLILNKTSIALTSFLDDFNNDINNTLPDGWIIPYNTCSTNWTIQNQKYGIRINSPCVTETVPSGLTIPAGISYSFEVDMTMTQSANMDRNFVFKYKDHQNWYGIHTIGSNVYLHKVINGVEYFLPNWNFVYGFLDNGTYHFKVEVRGNEFWIYIDNVLYSVVPDSNPTFPNSTAGLQASSGGVPTSEVWFDNVLVTELPSPSPSPSPTPTLTPTSTPTPTPTAIPTIGPFELPFSYFGRLGTDQNQFKSGFWGRLTAAFDHVFATGTFRPFTGNTYSPSDCPSGTLGITCYDSHNGTDFTKLDVSEEVFSIGSGSVVYRTDYSGDDCTSSTPGFGCVVIAKYSGNTYGLFAHLEKIFVNQGGNLVSSTQIGEMGKTGCPNCGEHLHFGVLRPVRGIKNSLLLLLMAKKDWQGLLDNIKPTDAAVYLPSCTYSAPNGTKFYFQDPSGWRGTGPDPWGQPKNKDGCGINSPYLWKYDIGTGP